MSNKALYKSAVFTVRADIGDERVGRSGDRGRREERQSVVDRRLSASVTY